MMLKGSLHQEGKTNLNMYALDYRISKYIKPNMSEMKEQTWIRGLTDIKNIKDKLY